MQVISDLSQELQLPSARQIRSKLFLDKTLSKQIQTHRQSIIKILKGQSTKKILLVGPCSLHSPAEALEFAIHLSRLAEIVEDHFLLIMRCYGEKARSCLGWKGMILDPYLDDSCKVEEGLRQYRKLLLEINQLGIPCATEFLDPSLSPYFEDLISWGSIGARTVESQIHRALAASLHKIPFGFKNNTSGNIKVAVEAVKASNAQVPYLHINEEDKLCYTLSKGNPNAHVVLRGGQTGSNFHEKNLEVVAKLQESFQLTNKILIDCSHGNSGKNPEKQIDVFNEVMELMSYEKNQIAGALIESNLGYGKQNISNDLYPGVSITDPCLDWDRTQTLILNAYSKLKPAFCLNPPS